VCKHVEWKFLLTTNVYKHQCWKNKGEGMRPHTFVNNERKKGMDNNTTTMHHTRLKAREERLKENNGSNV